MEAAREKFSSTYLTFLRACGRAPKFTSFPWDGALGSFLFDANRCGRVFLSALALCISHSLSLSAPVQKLGQSLMMVLCPERASHASPLLLFAPQENWSMVGDGKSRRVDREKGHVPNVNTHSLSPFLSFSCARTIKVSALSKAKTLVFLQGDLVQPKVDRKTQVAH